MVDNEEGGGRREGGHATNTYVCMYVFMCTCVYVCVCVIMFYIYIYIYIYFGARHTATQ